MSENVLNKQEITPHLYFANLSLIELKNVTIQFSIRNLKLKIVSIVILYLLVTNVHLIHKGDAVDSH